MESGKGVRQLGSFGEHLRREREMRGVSLDEIVATTKIGRRLLVALEEEQFDLLPGGIFNKSYVRAYAKCIGIDEDAAVAEYLEAVQEDDPEPKVIAHQHAFHSDRQPDRTAFPFMPLLLLLVIVASAVGGWKVYRQHRRDRTIAKAPEAVAAPAASGQPSSPMESSSSPAAVPAATQQAPVDTQVQRQQTASASISKNVPAATASNPGETPAGGPFEITVRPKDRAWISIKADGNYVVRGIIKPPDVKTVRASNEVILYTGNAGNVEVAFNGKAVPLAGTGNAPQTLVFSSKGVLPRAAGQ
jgi:cytoskeleton protein RodZ